MNVEMQTVGLICCKTTNKIIWKAIVLAEFWFKDTNPPNPKKSQVIVVTYQKMPKGCANELLTENQNKLSFLKAVHKRFFKCPFSS